jgi:hypothetical protein
VTQNFTSFQKIPRESGIEVNTLDLPFIYPMQVLSTEGVTNWPEDAYRVSMHIEDHEPQIVPLSKTCLQVTTNDETNTTTYTVIPEQVAAIQKVIVTAMTMAAKESKKKKVRKEATYQNITNLSLVLHYDDVTEALKDKEAEVIRQKDKTAEERKKEREEQQTLLATAASSVRDHVDPSFRSRQLAMINQPLPPGASDEEALAHFEKVHEMAVKKATWEAPANVLTFLEELFNDQKPVYKDSLYEDTWKRICERKLPKNSILGQGIPTWNHYMQPALVSKKKKKKKKTKRRMIEHLFKVLLVLIHYRNDLFARISLSPCPNWTGGMPS